jgi:WD40 repeat protein
MQLAEDIYSTVTRITLLPEEEKTCFILKGLFNRGFCEQLKNQAIAQGFCSANDKYPNSYRNNDRLVEDNKVLARQLYNACKPHMSNSLIIENINLTLDSLNERLRYCQYSAQQQFSIHRDGIFYQDERKRSALTFLLYLNSHDDFVGGETTFYKDQYGKDILATYTPEIGDVAIFDHTLWHSGNEVHQGNKYILRSDFIYSETDAKKSISSEKTKSQHDGYIWKVLTIDNNLLASASRDKTIKLWDKDFNCIQTLKKHQHSVFDLAADDQKNLYAVSRDGYMTKWKRDNKQYSLDCRVNTFHPSVLNVLSLPNHMLLTSGSDGIIRVWEKEQQIALLNAHKGWVWSLIKRDNNTFISCDSTGEVILWDIKTQHIIASTSHKDSSFRCMVIYRNDLFLGDEKGNIVKLNTLSLEYKNQWLAHTAIVRDILSTDDGIISCGEDNKVVLTDHNGENKKVLSCHSDFATSLSLLNDEQLISSSYSGKIESILL